MSRVIIRMIGQTCSTNWGASRENHQTVSNVCCQLLQVVGFTMPTIGSMGRTVQLSYRKRVDFMVQ